MISGNNNNNNNNGSGYDINPKGPFTWINGGISQIQLDIVGFLAVLGEGSILSNSQVAALSRVTFLPRLMPAPQALLRPSRPNKLSPHTGYTTAVTAGNYRDYINHIGHILVDAEHHPPYSVRCVRIIRKYPDEGAEKDSVKNGKMTTSNGSVTHTRFGPLWYVAVIGFSFSLVLLGAAIWTKDGMATLAVILLSLLSTLVGIGNKWQLHLPKRLNKNRWTPPGNVVIRYAKGSFLIVECSEDVARELFFAPEDIDYLVKDSWLYRIISLIGTVTLMFGVIFLGNAKTHMQLGIAGAYIIMNVLYWLVAALPSRWHWDTSCFDVTDQCIAPDGAMLPNPKGKKYIDLNNTFTLALWKAIVATKETGWIFRSTAAPDHPAWKQWLVRALEKAKTTSTRVAKVGGREITVWELPDWDAQGALDDCFAQYKDQELEGGEKG